MATTSSKGRARVSSRAKAETDITSILEDEFGNYLIKAGRLSGNFVARAFTSANGSSQGVIAEASGSSEADAIDTLKQILTARAVRRKEARRWELRSNISVPGKEEYFEAINQANLSDIQRSMLKAHALAGDTGLTVAELTKASGYKSSETARKAFARAGALIASYLDIKIVSEVDFAHNDPGFVLGFREKHLDDAPEVWVMHKELREAVHAAH